jgi:hypothetical protein
MSLEIAAKHLASKGRGPDTQLVHMTLGELNSLQELAKAHGGSLSINPDTGLPEAGFLSKILPMVAGAALTATGIGAPMAALLVGGGMTAATGSLEKGLMAGLGAYGGAGLGAGLLGAGGAAATPAAAGTSALDVLGQPLTGTAQAAGQGFGANVSQMGQGISNLTSGSGSAGFMQGVGGKSGLLKAGLAAAAPMMMGQEAQAPGIKPTTPTTPLQYNANPVGPTPKPDVPGYSDLGQDFGRQRRYFDHQFTPANPPAAVAPITPITNMPIDFNYAGGMAAGGPVEAMSAANVYDMQNARGGVSDMGIDNSTGMQRMARGGISHLGDYSDGGRLLRGPGDGVSDSIPAMIGEKQPARLADGEFVIPARIVGELGNGSTEAGARKLYAMMDRIQENRKKTIGEDNVAVDSRSDRFLPA